MDGQHHTQSTVFVEDFRLPTTLTGRQQVVELVKTQVKALKMLELVQGETDPNALEQAERRFWQLTLSAAAQNEVVRELVGESAIRQYLQLILHSLGQQQRPFELHLQKGNGRGNQPTRIKSSIVSQNISRRLRVKYSYKLWSVFTWTVH